MRLNNLKPSEGSKTDRKRVGRGIGSGSGKTAGRGHKGQKARSGGFHKVGFEGGQMPLQRRVPKFGFASMKAGLTEEVRLYELNHLDTTEITLESLKKAGLVGKRVRQVKIIKTGELQNALTVKGVKVTKGAAEAITAAGGTIED